MWDNLKWYTVVKVIRTIYELILRDALVAYVKSTENTFDDKLLSYVDLIIYSDISESE